MGKVAYNQYIASAKTEGVCSLIDRQERIWDIHGMTLWISRYKAIEVSIIGVGPKERPTIGEASRPCHVQGKIDNNNDQSESKGSYQLKLFYFQFKALELK